MPQLLAISYVTVITEDQDAALTWYTDVLGCEVTMDAPYGPEGERWLTVALPGKPAGAPEIMLYRATADERAQFGEPTPAAGIIFTVSDCAGLAARIEAHGGTIVLPPTDMGVCIGATWKDPFGNLFVIQEFPDRSADETP